MVQIQTGFVEAVERFSPSKMTKTKYSVPWIDATIKRLVKKDISFTLVLANQRTLMSRFRAHVKKVLKDAFWKHVLDTFTFENDSSDPDTPRPEKD